MILIVSGNNDWKYVLGFQTNVEIVLSKLTNRASVMLKDTSGFSETSSHKNGNHLMAFMKKEQKRKQHGKFTQRKSFGKFKAGEMCRFKNIRNSGAGVE